MQEDEKVLSAIARLSRKVDALAVQVDGHNVKLRWITSVALVVIGAVGGPNIVQIIASSGS
jgi:hypothetical protein